MYRIIATIQDELGVMPKHGYLYPLLHCMEEEKLIARLIVSAIGRAKVVFCLTPAGKEKLEKAFISYNFSMQKTSRFLKTRVNSLGRLPKSLKGRFKVVDTLR